MVYDSGLSGAKVVQIAAGSQHSLVLTSDGGVFAWGSNLEGQLGLHGVSGLINTPTRVHIPEPVKQISAGYYHSAFLTESGAVYVCGEAESGKLGIVLDFRTQLAPKQMSLSVKAVHVACGGHHTLVLGDDDNIYCTGSNASGQLGMGTGITEVQTPKQLVRGALDGEIIMKVVCGESHIAVVTGTGKIFTCGDGRHGKLGLEENENNVHELTYAIKYQELFVTNVACGGCHTILVGRRRESNNSDDESKQLKISALPPLKIPASRIQPDSPVEKPNAPNLTNNEENNEMEGKSTIIEKPETPKNPSDYSESEETKVKEDELSNEKDHKEQEDNEQESLKDDNSSSVQDTPKTEPNNSDENQRPMSCVSTSQTANKPEVNETDKSNEAKVTNEMDDTIGESDEKSEEANCNGDTGQEEEPPLPVPPPKPPRQKTGSAGSSSSENKSRKSSGMSTHSRTAVDDTLPEENVPETTSQGSGKKGIDSAGSGKSQSERSKTESNDTLPIETVIKNKVEEIEDQVEKEIEKAEKSVAAIGEKIGITDDADVVHSPVVRGKISKLFNLRKPEAENGNKIGSPQHSKAKSKTCSIL